ncbi:MAG: hypothetical protein U9Q92_05620 [archaeon]|nr:hypothetical protein [archaeon]
MADPKKIEIKKDLPTGKIIPKRIPLEMPPPPKAENAGNAPQEMSPRGAARIELPPLPEDLKPIIPHATPENTPLSTPKADMAPPPAAIKPVISEQTGAEKPSPILSPPPAGNDINPVAVPPAIPRGQDAEIIEAGMGAAPTPLQKEVKRRISHVKGPVFISLERYREVKGLLDSLKDNSRNLREIMGDFKDNKKEGNDLLTKSVDQLEHIEEDIENINATLRT